MEEEVVEARTELYVILDDPIGWVRAMKTHWNRRHTRYLLSLIGVLIVLLVLLAVGSIIIWWLSTSGLLLRFLTWVEDIG
jgi:hypothetical protein